MKLRVFDVFSGIGGFSHGLDRAGGFETVAFCEQEPFCRDLLAQHWPGVACYPDVRTVTAAALARDGISVDVLTGGFPCQDISEAGEGAGLAGERSGLWREYVRLVGEVRPRYAIVENVAGLLFRGLGDVLGDLAAIGFDAEWHSIPASAFGAPHGRDRVWVIAYPDAARLPIPEHETLLSAWWRAEGRATPECRWWADQPDVARVAYGVPGRVDRIKGLGNSVVPLIVERIGRAIVFVEQQRIGAAA